MPYHDAAFTIFKRVLVEKYDIHNFLNCLYGMNNLGNWGAFDDVP